MIQIDNINKLLSHLQNAFATEPEKGRLDKSVHPHKAVTKWSCYSDYCFLDANKPNDSISFAMLPFESEEAYQEFQEFIRNNQSKDLKELKTVNSAFLAELKSKGVITFTYILDDFKLWLGDDKDKQRDGIIECLQVYKTQYDKWSDTADTEEMKNYYASLSAQIDSICTKGIKDSEINTYIELLLVAVIGAVSFSEVAKRLDKVDILGWFSDRDGILDKGNGLVCHFFNAMLFCILQNQSYIFATYNLDSSVKPFFDDFNRISDILTGTIADYDVANNTARKKFGKVLRQYFADNPVAFVHRLSFTDDIKISNILMSLNNPEDVE